MAPAELDASPPFVARVLIVDDEPANLLALRAILEPLRAHVVTARSGAEALRCLLDEDFAVILMDVQMPGMDGLETAALIKQRRRTHNVPIIFVTGADRGGAARGYREGAVDWLLKPYEPDVLRAKVAVFVELEEKRARLADEEHRRRAREREELTRESEHRFQSLVDAMPLSIWAARPDGEITYENRRSWEASGVPPRPGVKAWELASIHDDDRAAARAAWGAGLSAGKSFDFQCRLLRRCDGSHRWHLVRVAPERSSQQVITGWIATATDIDEQRRAEEALGRLLEQEQGARQHAESASNLKDEFLAVVSHELRTPLTVILGWARVLRSGEKRSEEAPRAIAAIERNALAQARLVGDLLDVSRILTGKLRLEVGPMDLRAIVAAEVDAVLPAIQQKGLALAADVDEIGGFVGDPARLQQVCWNLLTNAIKFTPAGGAIELALRDGDGEVELSVRDSGQGIPASFLPHVFERFRQADATMTRAHGGLGLGLALVRDLVELHGGSIRAESAGEGCGATFTVTLPKRAMEAVPAQPPVSRASATDLDGVKVLVVDDEADTLELIANVLQSQGAEVRVAVSVADALEMLKKSRPDVLLSDLAMPREDGYALIRRVRSLASDEGGSIPAAALTAHAEAGVRERALEAGFQVYVAKPVDPARLAAVVAHLATPREAA